MNEEGRKLANSEGWLSIFGNILLFVLKFWAGIVSGSIAIIADAWHTLSDSLTSVVVLAGVKLSSRPADREHPFGHGRAELIAALIIGVLLSVVAFNFVVEGVQRLRDRQAVHYGTFAIAVTAFSILAKEAMARYAFWVAKRSASRSVRADAWHHRSDAISSIVILAGIFAGKHLWWIDGVLGIIVALLIFYAAYDILRDAMNTMLGEQPEPELISQIAEICHNESMLELHPHHIHVHRYGEHTELTMHIRLPDNMTLFDAHEIATRIELRLKNDFGVISTIHMEPEGLTHP
ncbi:cation diffusion facilitator family transporter [Lentimicrobium sp.]|jgi:cation diffusion facilitator family transporter|uniref:cation diffusion facilitator family transporter n=1 Tax=Lentimicrobium sp. TaxID=2034841 RepID=UPI0025F9D692|nr:cation diffusion facilitator family transporter [Lentimicrobium sp.]MCO5256149.1 cation diffusion facilitator family transporter [Lentimicrobium sp.]MCO5263251.1 cation diffusion facilitator family transporter [Lentimicrobium sp.]HOP13465.1 cation diffusion facilitator family transporter [Lentimicrobium sp.]HPF64085.1 cation diffusion facilitator family transporter [Lentimicrobium sp.]HPJ61347.1 cation diffusion facilitator family transporter [Lentimicrobium sp.]